MITQHGDPNSSSGGCSLTRLPACPVGTNAHVALRLRRKTHFLSNLVGNALQLSSADYIAWTEFGPPWLIEGRVRTESFPTSSPTRRHSFELEAVSASTSLLLLDEADLG